MTQKLIAQKYYWLELIADINIYIKGCNKRLILKSVRYMLYNDLQFFQILMHL